MLEHVCRENMNTSSLPLDSFAGSWSATISHIMSCSLSMECSMARHLPTFSLYSPPIPQAGPPDHRIVSLFWSPGTIPNDMNPEPFQSLHPQSTTYYPIQPFTASNSLAVFMSGLKTHLFVLAHSSHCPESITDE